MQSNIFIVFLWISHMINAFRPLRSHKFQKTQIVMNNDLLDGDTKYNLNWYVIGEAKKFAENKLYKKTIWNKNYLIWKKSF